MKRTIAGIAAGVLTTAVLALALDMVLMAIDPESMKPPMSTGVLISVFAGTLLATVAGGLVSGRVSRARPVRVATLMGIVGLVLSIGPTIALWDTAPLWYHVLTFALLVPAARVGGVIAARRIPNGPALG